MTNSTDWKTIVEDGLPPVGSCLIVTIKITATVGEENCAIRFIIWKRIMLRDMRST